MIKAAVLGAGTWGTALTIQLSKNGHETTLWSAVPREIEALKKDRASIPNLPGASMPENVRLTTDICEAVKDKDLLVFAVASPFVRSVAASLKDKIREGQIIVNVGKGIEEATLMTLTEVIADELPQARVAVLSGPSHAEEVSRSIPTAIVVGSEDSKDAAFIQRAFMNDFLRIYTSSDVIGIELGGSLKNVIALAAGCVDGLGYGDNTKAALMTRGIAEICRLGVKMGGKMETFLGLSGVGDLIVTCTSSHSRNHNAGYLIGQGKSTEEAMAEVKQVVEGVYCAKAAKKLAEKYGVEMPIVEEVNHVLFENKPAKESLITLFTRDAVSEYKK